MGEFLRRARLRVYALSSKSRTRVGLRVSTVLFTGRLLRLRRWPSSHGRVIQVVGVAGFEPTAPRSQSECATKLRYTPVCVGKCMRSL